MRSAGVVFYPCKKKLQRVIPHGNRGGNDDGIEAIPPGNRGGNDDEIEAIPPGNGGGNDDGIEIFHWF